jgi:hypothetical protein
MDQSSLNEPVQQRAGGAILLPLFDLEFQAVRPWNHQNTINRPLNGAFLQRGTAFDCRLC